jgi:uncharacterized membrane protein
MRDSVLWFIADMSTLMDVFGVTAIGLGGPLAIAIALRRARAGSWEDTYRLLRATFGRAILFGLEFLVAADIVRTVAVTPSLQSLAILAFIILIRTFLSFSLKAEIDGRLAWLPSRSE